MGDWIDDMFDSSPEHDYTDPNHNARKYAARLVRSSTLDREEQDELTSTLLDYSIEMDSDEVQDVIVRMQLNQQDPMQFYAPSKREIAAFIKKVCDL